MKKTYWIFVLCFLVLFSGCRKKEQETDTGFKIYYIDQDETKLMSENYTLQGKDMNSQINELMVAVKKQPTNPDMRLAIPEAVTFIGHNFGEAGQLQLIFDEDYNTVTGVQEVLMRASIVKTFTQIEGVKEVEFFINRFPLSKGDVLIGRMRADDFIDTVGEMTTYSQNAVISIYFSNSTGDALVESQRQVEYSGNVTLEQVIIEQLIDGPTEKKEEAVLRGTLPSDTILNKVTKKDGICSVDFNEAFLNPVEGISPEVTIYSIVNTLVEQPTVDKVQFTINGKNVESYKSIPFDKVFERNLNIIEGEK
ncbi:MAG: GerMN domain-containing protein [Clostridiales bacterium]|nr:GerMN domain-containing protein [Clostridiales bacterium]